MPSQLSHSSCQTGKALAHEPQDDQRLAIDEHLITVLSGTLVRHKRYKLFYKVAPAPTLGFIHLPKILIYNFDIFYKTTMCVGFDRL